MNISTQDSTTSPSIFESNQLSPNTAAQETNMQPIEITGDGDEEQDM